MRTAASGLSRWSWLVRGAPCAKPHARCSRAARAQEQRLAHTACRLPRGQPPPCAKRSGASMARHPLPPSLGRAVHGWCTTRAEPHPRFALCIWPCLRVPLQSPSTQPASACRPVATATMPRMPCRRRTTRSKCSCCCSSHRTSCCRATTSTTGCVLVRVTPFVC